MFLVAPAGNAGAGGRAPRASAIAGALAARDVQENFAKQGATATPLRPEALRHARSPTRAKRWAAVVKDAGIKAE